MLSQSSRRFATVFCFAGLLVAAVDDTASGQFSSRRSSDSVLRRLEDRRVSAELGLTDEVKKKISEARGNSRLDRDGYRAFIERIGKAKTEDDRKAIRAELTAAIEKKRKDAEESALKLLTEAQRTRLDQLKWRMHRSRTRVLLTDEAVATLKITDDQKKKIEEVLKARGDAALKAGLSYRSPKEEIEKFKKEWDPKTIAVLTADQQKQWMAMLGPELKSESETAKTADSKSGDSKTADAKTSPSGSATPTTPVVPTQPGVLTTKAPEDFTASFDPSTEAERKKAAVKYGTGATQKIAANDKTDAKTPAKKVPLIREQSRLMSFNFRNAPWQVVLEFFAKKTGLSLEKTKSPPDTLTYQDPNLYTPTEALDVLNGILLQKSFILVRRNRSLVVHDLTLPVPASLVPDVSPAELQYRGRNELMRVTFKIKKEVDMVEVTKDVEALSGSAPYAKVVTFATAHRVLVTNIGSNLMRIDENILEIQEPEDLEKPSFRRWVLVHIPARDAVKTISEQLGLQTGVTNVSASAGGSTNPFDRFRSGRSRSRTGISESEETQFGRSSRGGRGGDRSGGTDRRAQFMEMMRARMAGQSSGGNSRFGTSRTGSTRGGSTRRGTTGASTAKVSADNRTNAVLVTASLQEINLVEQIVLAIDVPKMQEHAFEQNLDDTEPYLKVYKVYKADVREVTKSLNVLIPNVVVNEDARNDAIHIKATREQHAYVVELLKELDLGSGVGGSKFAVIPLKSLDPVPVVVTLTAMFADEKDNAPSIQADAAGRRILIKGTDSQIASVTSFVKSLEGDGVAGSGAPRTVGNSVSIPITGDGKQLLDALKGALNDSNVELRVINPASPDPIKGRVIPSDDSGISPSGPRRKPFGDRKTRETTSDARGVQTRHIALGNDHERPVDSRGVVMARPRNFGVAKARRQPQTRQPQPRTATRRQPVRSESKQGVSRNALSEISALVEPGGNSAGSPVNAETAQPKKKQRKKAAKTPNAKKQPATRRSGPRTPVSVIVRDGQLIITSDDPAALNRVQQLVQALLRSQTNKTIWTVFYLRTADATQTAAMLEQIFPQSSVLNSDAGGGGLMSGLTSGLTNFGSNVADITGLSSLGQAESLRIIPDVRTNSLFVSGPTANVRDVERVLKILDEDKLPASLRERIPRMIPVYYANVFDVYQNVSDVYKDYMQPTRGSSNNGANMLALLAGGGRGNSRGGRSSRGGGSQQQQQVRLTLSVDERTGQLIVSSSDSLFQQIDDLVYSLDKAAYDAKPTSRVVQLVNATPSVISQTLTSMYPNVTVSVTNNSKRQTRDSGSQQQQQRPQGSDDIRNMMRTRALQQMMGGSRGGSGDRGGARGGIPSFGGNRGSRGGIPSFGGNRGSTRGGTRGGRGGRGR